MDMLIVMSVPIRMFLAWFQRCRCHSSPRLSKLCGFKVHRVEKIDLAPCPLAGRNAGDMAPGLWKTTLDDLFQFNEADVLKIVSGLSAGQRDVVKRDWERGKAVFVFELSAKFDFWNHLPHKLCALPARDQDAAHEAIAE